MKKSLFFHAVNHNLIATHPPQPEALSGAVSVVFVAHAQQSGLTNYCPDRPKKYFQNL
ncbi:hypothetical protein [Steroidobacter sp.]|uniref:hypothetical protein n=1 Tax=Steroidobacter sp. TaxID=1978227 RepID=UPI001A4F72DF|nr:hypothetical protein [Steroidobacter sp.]MBL8269992.1 hypothetical protein [Steroidobacter sp.]